MTGLDPKPTLTLVLPDGSYADKTDLDRNKHDGRFRPNPDLHSLDQMTLHRSDSGHSFQVQQSHGCERRFIAGTACNEPQLSDVSNAKLAIICKGTEFVYKTIKKLPKLKVTYGTDIFNDPETIEDEIRQMARLKDWHRPYEILAMATGNGGELLKLSGIRNPYPGYLGVVKKGAYADLLLIEGNPLDDIAVMGKLDNLKVIIKDGKVHKNAL
jgi:hypothetical protein